MRDTGKILTADEIVLVRQKLNTPLVALNAGMPETPSQMVHRMALAKGLPEIIGYYGADLEDGTILAPEGQ